MSESAVRGDLRLFVFIREYAVKVILSLSKRRKIFTSDWILMEVCQNAVLSKNRYHYDNNKQKTLKSIKNEFCAI